MAMIEDLITVLKKVKEQRIITQLQYRELNPENEQDLNTINLLTSFDEEGTCFGDYDVLDTAGNYYNLGIYLEGNLIGYLAYAFHQFSIPTIFNICLCLKKEYRSLGIGRIILLQAINTIFTCYDDINNIIAEIVYDNEKSLKMVKRIGFKEDKSRQSLFLSQGKLKVEKCFNFNYKNYLTKSRELTKYRCLNIK